MRILFLDIDGVLNSHRYLYRPDRDPGMEFSGNEHLMLDPIAVKRLNEVLLATEAKVVISSSWRIGWTLPELRTIFTNGGVAADVIDVTPTYGTNRGSEILAWLVDHDEGNDPFAIVDDDLDLWPLLRQLVNTTFKDGLLDIHVEELIERLTDTAWSNPITVSMRLEDSRRRNGIISG